MTQLGVGEALVSMLDEKGRPNMVEQTLIKPPKSQIGPIKPAQRKQILADSLVAGVYEKTVDRKSAYEILAVRAEEQAKKSEAEAAEEIREKEVKKPSRRSSRQTPTEAFVKSAMRAVGTRVGRKLVRGILGSLFGGK